MKDKYKVLWQVSREYAGIAEAGGVKNVACSLSEELHKQGWDVTVFIPLYGCTMLWDVEGFDLIADTFSEISIHNTCYRIAYAKGYYNGVHIVFIICSQFTGKIGVYTYTGLEEKLDSSHKRGDGHADADVLNTLFQKAVLDYGIVSGKKPDIIQCQDAPTASIPFIARKDSTYLNHYTNTRFVVTIHNAGAGYHHSFDSTQKTSSLFNLPIETFEGSLLNGRVEPFLLSEPFATLTTVSPWYADELCDPNNPYSDGLSREFYERKTLITGITNGIDYKNYDPSDTKISKLPFSYDPSTENLDGKYNCRAIFLEKYAIEAMQTENDTIKLDSVIQYGTLLNDQKINTDDTNIAISKPVYFSFHGRMVHQKGVDILAGAARTVLAHCDNARFIITGQGARELEELHCNLARDYPGRYLYLQGYKKSLARLCVAVSDFIVLPSIFEPCGLEDFIAQIYGTIPIAHACGGLQKILHEKTGFLYNTNTSEVLSALLLDLSAKKRSNPKYFNGIIVDAAQCVKTEYSWKKIIQEHYALLFTAI